MDLTTQRKTVTTPTTFDSIRNLHCSQTLEETKDITVSLTLFVIYIALKQKGVRVYKMFGLTLFVIYIALKLRNYHFATPFRLTLFVIYIALKR